MAFIIWWQKADMERIREYLLLALTTTSWCHISSRKAALASYLRGAAFRQAFHTSGLRPPTRSRHSANAKN